MFNQEVPKHILLGLIGVCIVVGMALGVTFIRQRAITQDNNDSQIHYVFPEDDQSPVRAGKRDPQDNSVTQSKPKTDDRTFCAQVITPAVNPKTKEVKDFPTPCDVPDGWEALTQ